MQDTPRRPERRDSREDVLADVERAETELREWVDRRLPALAAVERLTQAQPGDAALAAVGDQLRAAVQQHEALAEQLRVLRLQVTALAGEAEGESTGGVSDADFQPLDRGRY